VDQTLAQQHGTRTNTSTGSKLRKTSFKCKQQMKKTMIMMKRHSEAHPANKGDFNMPPTQLTFNNRQHV